MEAYVKSKGGTPEEIAEILFPLNVYEGVPDTVLGTMRKKTLGGRGQATFTTVMCFAHGQEDALRKNVILTSLRGFLATETPDFLSLLDGTGFRPFFVRVVCSVF